MKKSYTEILKTASEFADVEYKDARSLIQYLVKEIELELSHGYSVTIPGLVSLVASQPSYKERYSPKFKRFFKVDPNKNVKATVSRTLKKNVSEIIECNKNAI